MRGQPFPFDDFHGGLNSNDAAFLITPNECRDCLNVNSTVKGAIVQRGGTAAFAAAPSQVAFNTLYPFETYGSTNAAVKYLIAVNNSGSIYSVNSAAGLNVIASGKTASTPWEFAQFPSLSVPGASGYLFGVNGTDTPLLWSATSAGVAASTWSTQNPGTTSTTAASGTNRLTFSSLPVGFAPNAWIQGHAGIDTATTILSVTDTQIVLSKNLIASVPNGTALTATTRTDFSTTTMTAGSIPNGRFVAQWQNRLWIAGSGSKGGRVYYSEIADGFTWRSTSTLDLDTADGEQVTSMIQSGPYLLIFKESKAYAVYDVDPDLGPLFRTISGNIGTCAHRSVVETPRGAYFLSPDKGVWMTDGTTAKLVSKKISPDTVLMPTYRSKATAAYFNDHYYLSLPSSSSTGQNDKVLDYDMVLDSWWKHDNPVEDYAVWRSSTTSDAQLYGARYAAKNGVATGIDRLNIAGTTQDLGADFTVRWVSAWHTFGAPQIKKRLRRMKFDGSGAVNASLSVNFSVGWIPYASLALTTVQAYTFGSNPATFGNEIGVFGGSVTNASATIYGIGGDIGNGKTAVGRTISIKFDGLSSGSLYLNSYTMAITTRKN